MRCINCGYADNPPGRTTCSQCGQPLSDNSYGAQIYRSKCQNTAFDPRQKTRVIGREDLEKLSLSEREPATPEQCPKCNYPLLEGYNICPYCGTELHKGIIKDEIRQSDLDQSFICEHCGKEVSTAFSYCPSCGQKLHLPTVSFNNRCRKGIKAEPLPECKCSLTIIPEEDEAVEAIRNEYRGAEVQLKRENTEPKNRTITSKGQALLECDDNGQWYITNQSEQGTTVLQVTRKTPIQNGDIIMLGNRSFRFEIEE